jgi:hypothetical protein
MAALAADYEVGEATISGHCKALSNRPPEAAAAGKVNE